MLLAFEYLLKELEDHKADQAEFQDRDHFRLNVNAAWQKLDEYYSKLDETPVYYAALALHPAYRWRWFDNNWTGPEQRNWVTDAKAMVKSVWREQYRRQGDRARGSTVPQISQGAENQDGESQPKRQKSNGFRSFAMRARTGTDSDQINVQSDFDEYDYWIDHPEDGDCRVEGPIGYWHERRERYPDLSRMALDFLTVQPMSAECERLFSAAGRMVTAQRGNLDSNTIGMCQVLRSWLRAGVIQKLDPLFYGVADEEEDRWVTYKSLTKDPW